MSIQGFTLGAALVAMVTLTACTDNQGVNAATGALGGAAVGSLIGNGNGRTAAMLGGAAVGGVLGGRAPTN